MFKFLSQLFVDKDSIRSKQNALSSLVNESMKEADRIQTSVTNLQTTNNQIDATVKEVEEMKNRYDILEQELQARKSQNEVYINMFRPQQ